MIDAVEHAAVIDVTRAAQRQLQRLAPVLGQLAWAAPRAAHGDEMRRALRSAARAALS